ncbi:MAG: hypothetical protein V4640_07260 [Verrucomicrobiota bacterium]
MKTQKNPFLALIFAHALTLPAVHAAAVTLKAGGDAGGTSSFAAVGNWDPAIAPAPGNTYAVSVQFLRTPQDGLNYPFLGDSLTLNTGGAMIYKGTAATNTYTIANFILNGGLVRSGSSSANTMILAGGINVTGTGSTINADQGPYIIDSLVSGTGTLTNTGGYTLTFNGANTYTGNLTVSSTGGGTVLSATSQWKFAIGANTVSNTILGAGKITFNGAFNLDLSGASTTVGHSWNLVNNGTLNELYGETFNIPGFTSTGFAGSRVWTGGGGSYQFLESTGVLSVIQTDSDGDGLADAWENTHFANWPTPGQADPLRFVGSDDADNDGATNEQEESAGSNPTSASSWPDVDGDGMRDAWEVLWFTNITSQNATGDADGDLATNLQEFLSDTIPVSASSWPDTDADNMNDGWETVFFGNLSKTGLVDSDADAYTDRQEHDAHTDPTVATGALLSPISSRLKNRWSFNGTLTDSIGGSDATVVAGTTSSTNAVVWNNLVPASATAIKMTGGAKADSDWIKLGSNLLPKRNTPVTLEFWVKQDAIQNWSRIFDFHADTTDFLMMNWTRGTDNATDRIEIRDAGAVSTLDNLNQPYGTTNEHHIVMTLTPMSDEFTGNMGITIHTAPSNATDLGAAKGGTTTVVNLVNLNDFINALGFSAYADNTASATYNEVRIWNGALTTFAREKLHDQGPDNAVLADSDNDFLPDAWEEIYFPGNLTALTKTGDRDGDSIIDRDEYAVGSNPNNSLSTPTDIDGDGLVDAWEIQYFANVTAQNGAGDPDGDGLTNEQEETNGSDPTDDNDGLDNAWEILHFGNITAQNGTGNPDGDAFDNEAEETAGSNPNNNLSIPGDINADGITDGHRLTFADPLGTASFNSGANWDDLNAPVAGANYLVTGFNLRTPDDAVAHTFAGDKLVMGTSSVLVVKGTGIVTVPYLGLDGGEIRNATSTNAVFTLGGAINVSRASAIYPQNNSIIIDASISGSKDLGISVAGANSVTFNAANPWTGNLNVTGSFVLGATGSLKFAPTASGVNNAILGSGTAVLNGAFVIDLGAASSSNGSSWDLITTTGVVTVAPSFTVSGFTADAGAVGARIWTSGVYTFAEATGVLSVSAGNDSDSDGLADTWETTYGLIVGTNDAADDKDGDGTSNLTEFRLGLIPNNGSSRFAATRSAAGLLQWPSATGLTFTVRRSATLAAGSWTTIATVPGTAGTASFTDPSPLAGKAFYQVLLQP